MSKRISRRRARVIERKRARKAQKQALQGGHARQVKSDKWDRRPEPIDPVEPPN